MALCVVFRVSPWEEVPLLPSDFRAEGACLLACGFWECGWSRCSANGFSQCWFDPGVHSREEKSSINLPLLSKEILHVQTVGFEGKTLSWECDVVMLLFWNRCCFLPALPAGVAYLTQELKLQFGLALFALPSPNRSNSTLEHPRGWSIPGAGARRGIPAVPAAPACPRARDSRVTLAGSRYDCVPPPPKAPVTALGTSYDCPLSPPPLGSAAESPF